jgi:hypothetical protein
VPVLALLALIAASIGRYRGPRGVTFPVWFGQSFTGTLAIFSAAESFKLIVWTAPPSRGG